MNFRDPQQMEVMNRTFNKREKFNNSGKAPLHILGIVGAALRSRKTPLPLVVKGLAPSRVIP